MKRLFPIIMILIVAGCASNESASTKEASKDDAVYSYTPDGAADSTVAPSTDPNKIEGTYTGTLPCTSCDGIETSITLYDDQSFLMKESYKGTAPLDSFTNKGKYEVKGNRLYLKLDGAGIERPVIYAINPNSLTQLDMNGNPIKSNVADHYILMKN